MVLQLYCCVLYENQSNDRIFRQNSMIMENNKTPAERVAQERAELSEKINKLAAFLQEQMNLTRGGKDYTIDVEHVKLLARQHVCMCQYIGVLEKRIELFEKEGSL